MGKGYAEGPAAEERFAALERGDALARSTPVEDRRAVYGATVYDPEVLTEPWVVPTQTLELAPFDQIMPLNCAGS